MIAQPDTEVREPAHISDDQGSGSDTVLGTHTHPGAQLSLFETSDGWRYSLWVSNVAAGLRGWRAQLGYIDAAHRVHARVEDWKACSMSNLAR